MFCTDSSNCVALVFRESFTSHCDLSVPRIPADFRGVSPPAFHMDLFAEGLNTNL